MQLILVRHGIAEEPDAAARNGRDEAARELTIQGIEHTREAMAGLATLLDPAPELIHSPYTRARQTATLVSEAAGGGLQESEALLPHASRAGFLHQLAVRSPGGTVIAVGHEPWLSSLIAAALNDGLSGGVEMKKAAAARIGFPMGVQAGRGMLEWLLPPKVLRGLAP